MEPVAMTDVEPAPEATDNALRAEDGPQDGIDQAAHYEHPR